MSDDADVDDSDNYDGDDVDGPYWHITMHVIMPSFITISVLHHHHHYLSRLFGNGGPSADSVNTNEQITVTAAAVGEWMVRTVL